MSQENVSATRAAFEDFARRGVEALRPLHADFEFATSPELPDAGVYKGEEALRFMERWARSWDEKTVEPQEFVDAGDKVLVMVRERGKIRGSSAEVEGHWWYVCTYRGDVLIRIAAYPDRAQALEAAGLSESSR
jgi:ketosteroid isomerase-like protein